MNERTRSLLLSLVGGSIEFSFKKNANDITTIEKNIQLARRNIGCDIEMAFTIGGELCVMLLAELTNHYRNEVYYMAVRSAIEMRRYRPAVLDYLQLSIEKRAERLHSVLAENPYKDRNRDFKVTIAKYFLNTYPNRLPAFKDVLSREEYLLVA